MKISVNGKPLDLEREMSITDFLRSKNVVESMVAVEHNLRWLRRDDWSKVTLKQDDRLEVIRIMAGG